MPKSANVFACATCGHSAGRWFGRCPECGDWNSAFDSTSAGGAEIAIGHLGQSDAADVRVATDDAVDRVLGGGLVPGSVVLLAGEPGIGKSTLLLQLMDAIVQRGGSSLLAAGEESPRQVSLRARRVAQRPEGLRVVAVRSLERILAAASSEKPDLLVVDSIQSVAKSEFDQPPGSLVQVRECAGELVRRAKESGTAILISGHVTKDGTVAGPKTLEHLVDAVLNLEGDRSGSLRLLRATKNRFGSCEEVGVFTMENRGLTAVSDPSALFLADRSPNAIGSLVFPAIRGTRPMLVEIQALAPKQPSSADRVALGVDSRRLSLMLGVITQHAAANPEARDVFVAAAGGLTVDEPAADLALCLTLLSALKEEPLDRKTAAVGEVGLGGEVRRVPAIERRIGEAERMGFDRILVPPRTDVVSAGAKLVEVRDVRAGYVAARARISSAAA
jgi:DNA repair protein RadA/Sms